MVILFGIMCSLLCYETLSKWRYLSPWTDKECVMLCPRTLTRSDCIICTSTIESHVFVASTCTSDLSHRIKLILLTIFATTDNTVLTDILLCNSYDELADLLTSKICLEFKFFRLLGYYAAWGGFKSTFRDYLLVPSSRDKLSHNLFCICSESQITWAVNKYFTVASRRTRSN